MGGVKGTALNPDLGTRHNFRHAFNNQRPQLAVHFTPSGRPVTLSSPAVFLLLSIVTLLVVLLVCPSKLREPGAGDSLRTLLRYYFTVAVMVLIYFGVLIYNVYI